MDAKAFILMVVTLCYVNYAVGSVVVAKSENQETSHKKGNSLKTGSFNYETCVKCNYLLLSLLFSV